MTSRDATTACWRLLQHDGVGAAEGLAGDEALLLCYGRGGEAALPAALRLYTYRSHAALVGRYQSVEDEVDLAFCAREGLEVSRRPTGGGAILMGEGQLGVALATRARASETPRGALVRFAGYVAGGLAEVGVEARFRDKNDLCAGERKIAGLGLYLDDRGALLFHASVLVDLDVELMLRALRIPRAKWMDKAVSDAARRVTTVSRELGRSLRAAGVRAAFARGFARAAGVELVGSDWSPAERARARELAAGRYGAREWIFQDRSRRAGRGSALFKTPRGLVRVYVSARADAIQSALFYGDYNEPPHGVLALESALRWTRLERRAVLSRVRASAAAEGLGVSDESLASAILEAAARSLERAMPARERGACYAPAEDAAREKAREKAREESK